MNINEKIVLSIPIESLANTVSEIILKKLSSNVNSHSVNEPTVYLTRKQSYSRLGITGPTFDKLIRTTNTEKLGHGKGARFRKDDIEKIYENLGKLLYKR